MLYPNSKKRKDLKLSKVCITLKMTDIIHKWFKNRKKMIEM